jgi:PhzF family phenazine biosynthesis protein
MRIPLHHVDAFTAQPFAGNPAAVCLLSAERDAAWMLGVAREMNLPMTAFVRPQPPDFGLRWFATGGEVDLCGHATLATAHVLWETERLAPQAQARFHTRGGLLTARRDGAWIEMDFPTTPVEPVPAPDGLETALGAVPRFVGRSRFDYLVELESEAAVRALRPDLAAVRRLDSRGLVATARAGGEDDFVSRFFAPNIGIDEDPATGSTHCALAPFWSSRLGRTSLVARQLSTRGGRLKVRLLGDRTALAGQAVTVLRGELVAG